MMTRREALRAMALSAAATTLPALAGPGAGAAAAAPDSAAKATVPTGPFKLPPLPYPPDALEPHVDAETMTLHHDKHHAAYVSGLNQAVAGKPELEKKTVEELIRDLDALPSEIRTAVRNHGGGHANHSLFWTILKKDAAAKPAGPLAAAIDRDFGGFDALRTKLDQAATSVFGSGWAWLSLDQGKLVIETTPNQDSPLMQGHQPVMGIDVWEHAYYLKHRNRRADYLAAIARVTDWDAISARYRTLTKS
jgi:Fe-Mn family superoxide dismutase